MTRPGGDHGIRRSVVFLVLLTLFASGVNLFWTAHLVNSDRHGKCGTVLAIASLPVPSRDITPGAHRFDQSLTEAFADRARELGCR